jgi:hypothetical protein
VLLADEEVVEFEEEAPDVPQPLLQAPLRVPAFLFV